VKRSALVVDALVVALAASAPVLIERLRGLAHAGGDLGLMFIPHYAWWWSRPRWLGGWNPFIFGGFPSNADPLVGHVHPLGVLWALFSPLDAAALEGAAAPVLAGLGMLLYLRRIDCGRTGSVVGALAFACGGYVHAHAMHPEKLRTVLAIPWALAAIEALDGRRLVAGLALAVAVLVAGGHPQTIAFSLALVALYGLVFEPGGREHVLAGLGVGVAIPAVTWLPAFELVARSHHAHTMITGVDHMTAACAHTLVVPFGCGGGGGSFYGWSLERFPGCGIVDCTGYPGMLVWLLVLAGLPSLAATGRGRFWIGIAIAGLVLSTEVTERLLPIPGVRAPSRALLWWSVASAVGAAMVMRPGNESWRGRARWGAALVLACVIAWAATRDPAARRASLGSLGVLVVTVVAASRPSHWALVAALAADLGVFGAELHVGIPPQFASEATAVLDRAATVLQGADRTDASPGRAIAIPALQNAMWAQVERVPILQGWDVLVPDAFSKLLAGDVAEPLGYDFGLVTEPALLARENRVLDLLRARVVLVNTTFARDPRWGTVLGDPRWRRSGELRQWHVYTNTRARPVAWLVHRVRSVTDDEAVRMVRGEAGSFDPAEEALTRASIVTSPRTGAEEVAVVSRDDDELVLRVRASAAALLVTSELAYPGWAARVDDRVVPVRSVNAGFRAVEVTAGEHEVVLRYRPRSSRAGLGLGAVGMLIVVACAWPRRRGAHPATA
jgi:hypothetical protein